jgi:hypothetical protein
MCTWLPSVDLDVLATYMWPHTNSRDLRVVACSCKAMSRLYAPVFQRPVPLSIFCDVDGSRQLKAHGWTVGSDRHGAWKDYAIDGSRRCLEARGFYIWGDRHGSHWIRGEIRHFDRGTEVPTIVDSVGNRHRNYHSYLPDRELSKAPRGYDDQYRTRVLPEWKHASLYCKGRWVWTPSR